MNKKQDDDLFTNVEPIISYCSSSLNIGVTAIFSDNKRKSIKRSASLFLPESPKCNFSLCNTIMMPFIINKETVEDVYRT